MQPQPTIGRSVHFNSVDDGGKPKPQHAVIVDVKDVERSVVTLQVTNWYGTTTTHHDIRLGDTPGTWSWPTRV